MSRFKLYNSANSSLVYEFPVVQNHNADSVDGEEYISFTNRRASGAVYVKGGYLSEDLFIEGYFIAENYKDIKTAISGIKSTIVSDTIYILRVYYNDTQYNTYTVKRMDKIECTVQEFQNNIQPYRVVFKTFAG